jgi:hypothetical protein
LGYHAAVPVRCCQLIVAACIVATSPPIGTIAQTQPATAPTYDAAVQRGLDYLAKHQNADGSFDATDQKVAITGLSVMAFLACGHTPEVGRYGLVVRGGVDFLLAQAQPDGYFGKAHGKGMYDQGIVTLALAEAVGAEVDNNRRARMYAELTKAVKVILDAQAVAKPGVHSGGWRYDRKSADSDLSLSGWNALALRAAQDVGVPVPKEAVQKAVGFVLRCYNEKEGGFSYQPQGGAQIGPTAIGVLSLYLLDGADRPERARGEAFLAAHPVNEDTPFPYYAAYYATQAANQGGGAVWDAVSKALFERLLAKQNRDGQHAGAWPRSNQEPGEVYSTAMAVLTLAVPQRLLPAYQR